jgi:hypothetical protein
MGSKAASIYNSAIQYVPKWEPPETEILDALPIDMTFAKHVDEFHTGLKSITMNGLYRESSGEPVTVKVQRFKMIGSGMNKKPGIESEDLARVLIYAAQQHCNALKAPEVVYRCFFYGDSDELGRNFQKTATFRLQPEAEPEDEEDPNENNNDVHNEEDISPRRHSLIHQRRPPGVPQQYESELINILKIQTAQSNDLHNSQRAAFQQLREDMSAALQSVGDAYIQVVDKAHEVIDKLGQEVDHARKEASQANMRLVKMSEEHSRTKQGENNTLQYAMDMFNKALQTQWSALGRDMAWERQIMYQQFEALATDTKKENRRGWVKDFAPIFLAVGGQLIEKMGNKAQGKILQELATNQLNDDDEEEEEDEEEEVVKDTEKPKPPERPKVNVDEVIQKPSVMGVPAGSDPESFFSDHPVASQFQLFGTMLKQNSGQLTKLKKMMGPKIYRMLQQAMTSKDDAEARTRGTLLLGSVLMAPGLNDKVEKVLNEEQRELLGDISKQLFGEGGFEKPDEAKVN